MIVHHRDRWIYVAPTKTASSMLHTVLQGQPFFGVDVDPYNQHHMTVPLGLDDYRLWTTCRNPFGRMASLWRHWCSDCCGNNHEQVVAYAERHMPFSDFVARVDNGSLRRPKWAPKGTPTKFFLRTQAWFWAKLRRGPDAYVQVERLEQELAALPWLPADIAKYLPDDLQTRHQTRHLMAARYTETERQAVMRWAAEDFSICKYSTEPTEVEW